MTEVAYYFKKLIQSVGKGEVTIQWHYGRIKPPKYAFSEEIPGNLVIIGKIANLLQENYPYGKVSIEWIGSFEEIEKEEAGYGEYLHVNARLLGFLFFIQF